MPCATHVILETGAGKVGLQPRSLHTFPLNPLNPLNRIQSGHDSGNRRLPMVESRKKMTPYEILSPSTAILTSQNTGHASNFFFLLAYAVFSEVKHDLQGAKNLEKSIKTGRRLANGREEFEKSEKNRPTRCKMESPWPPIEKV